MQKQGILNSFFGDQPVAVLVRKTAANKWWLIAINFLTALLEALSEGISLSIIFLSVNLLSRSGSHNIGDLPIIKSFPILSTWISSIKWPNLFIALMVLAVVLQAIRSLSRYANSVSLGYFNASCRSAVLGYIHQQILSFSYGCASLYKAGELSDHVTQGPESVRIQIQQFGSLVVNSILTLIYLTVLVVLSPWLLLSATIVGLVLFCIQRSILPRIKKESRQLSRLQISIASRVTEDIQGLRMLHSTGQLEPAVLSMSSEILKLDNSLRRQSRLVELTDPITNLLPIIAVAFLSIFSLLLFQNTGSGILPILTTFVISLQRLVRQMGFIAINFNQLAENTGRLERLNLLLTPIDKEFRRVGGLAYTGFKKSICLENVSLRYSSDTQPALSKINIKISKGQTVALVGSSGAGKSSLADLLVGLYDPTEGIVRIDDDNLKCLDLSSWQKRLGIVSQDVFLFNETIEYNISFGSPRVNKQAIVRAAKQAQAHEFISKLPNGYSTIVGERGYRLSGGQRQRIALARAILRQPDLLILDEATSALDTESEKLVQEAISNLSRKTTILVIAHRLSTVVSSDQIIVLENGRVFEQGNHASLIQLNGRYASLWRQQSRVENALHDS